MDLGRRQEADPRRCANATIEKTLIDLRGHSMMRSLGLRSAEMCEPRSTVVDVLHRLSTWDVSNVITGGGHPTAAISIRLHG